VSVEDPPRDRPSREPSAAPASFEESIRRLAEIVKRLEEGELTLEESLGAFERGIALAREAQRRLDAAEARVDELIGVDEQGRPVTRPIAMDAGAGEPSSRTR
jgi:exodeoxyribonuclease VII small subunit